MLVTETAGSSEKQKGKGQNMFHLVGHTCKSEQPGVTGGDMWLEAKGKQRHTALDEKDP